MAGIITPVLKHRQQMTMGTGSIRAEGAQEKHRNHYHGHYHLFNLLCCSSNHNHLFNLRKQRDSGKGQEEVRMKEWHWC